MKKTFGSQFELGYNKPSSQCILISTRGRVDEESPAVYPFNVDPYGLDEPPFPDTGEDDPLLWFDPAIICPSESRSYPKISVDMTLGERMVMR